MAQTMQVGTYRLVHRDNNDNTLAEILEKHSTEFGGVAGTPQSDPQKMPKVKKDLSPLIREDDKLVIMFKPSTTLTEHTTSTAAVDTIRIPVTIKNRRSGVVYEKTLISGDFTDRRGYANSQIWTSGVWYDTFSLTLGAQLELKVGHRVQDVRVDSALNLQKDSTTS
jgi:hypothetical protein